MAITDGKTVRILLPSQDHKQAYDGETAWIINPFMGSDNAVEITGPEGDGLRESADMDGLLWNYKEKGHQLELEGSGEEDGKSVFILKLTKKTGNTDYYYIDQESYLVHKQKSKSFLNGVEVEVETFLNDYRDVEGCMMPFQTTQRADGQEIMNLKLEKVELNVPLDDFSGKSEEHLIEGTVRGGGISVELRTSDGRASITYE